MMRGSSGMPVPYSARAAGGCCGGRRSKAIQVLLLQVEIRKRPRALVERIRLSDVARRAGVACAKIRLPDVSRGLRAQIRERVGGGLPRAGHRREAIEPRGAIVVEAGVGVGVLVRGVILAIAAQGLQRPTAEESPARRGTGL